MNAHSFWSAYSIKNKASQPGNPHSAGQKRNPSKGHSLTPEKAKEILRHGEVRGHKLTPAQRGFFGARAGGAKRKK